MSPAFTVLIRNEHKYLPRIFYMPDRKKNKILSALRRYFSGNKSDEGEKIFSLWFKSFDDSEGYLDQLNEEDRLQYKNDVFRSLQKKLNKTDSVVQIPLHKKLPEKRNTLYRVAAILLIGTLLSLAGIYMSGVTESEEIPVVMVERSNPVGQISEFILPDGSTVWLSAASTLEYPETFSEMERTVELNGEAFFEVQTDADRPFVVNSGPLTTSVLGTSFNITAYQDDPDMVVTLATGKVEVAVQGSEQKLVLEPNQKVSYKTYSGLSDVSQIDARLARAWIQRELIFIREDFATIARTFERWYGVEFVFEDESLKDETFVYHFKELSLQNSMIVLKELAEFEYEIEEERVVINRSGNE